MLCLYPEISFPLFLQLKELALANIGSIDNRNDLTKRLSVLSPEELKDLVCSKVWGTY